MNRIVFALGLLAAFVLAYYAFFDGGDDGEHAETARHPAAVAPTDPVAADDDAGSKVSGSTPLGSDSAAPSTTPAPAAAPSLPRKAQPTAAPPAAPPPRSANSPSSASGPPPVRAPSPSPAPAPASPPAPVRDVLEEVSSPALEGDVMVWGLDKESIHEALLSNTEAYRQCYEEWAENTPGLGGKLTIQFTIGKDSDNAEVATIIDISAAESELNHAFFEGCVMNVISGLKFEPPEEGTVSVHIPYRFRAEEE